MQNAKVKSASQKSKVRDETHKINYKFWKLPVITDFRGSLCPIEFSALPFKPRRVYFLFNTKKARGGHAHEKEQEIFVCIKGNFRARIHSGRRWHSFKMSKPGQALYVPHLVWHEFDRFNKNAAMLAISSVPYSGKKGYIMDFSQFLIICQKKS